MSSGDVVYKVVDRRQKRMIKNRESAARSRARKQAYTSELEGKVACLEEENLRLKREKPHSPAGIGHVIEVCCTTSRTESTTSENKINLFLTVCTVQGSGRLVTLRSLFAYNHTVCAVCVLVICKGLGDLAIL